MVAEYHFRHRRTTNWFRRQTWPEHHECLSTTPRIGLSFGRQHDPSPDSIRPAKISFWPINIDKRARATIRGSSTGDLQVPLTWPVCMGRVGHRVGGVFAPANKNCNCPYSNTSRHDEHPNPSKNNTTSTPCGCNGCGRCHQRNTPCRFVVR